MRKRKNSELGRLSIEAFKETPKIPVVVVLDNIRSLHNVGSVFRTSDALLIESVYLCGFTAQPPHPEIHKTALGATESVQWEYFDSGLAALEALKKESYTLIAIEQVEGSIPLNHFLPNANEKYALFFGNEVRGVQQEIVDACHHAIEIPQYGTKHSFNISVSVGIVLWDFFSKIRL